MASNNEAGAAAATRSTSSVMEEPEEPVEFFSKKKSILQIMQEKKKRAQQKKQKTERRRSTQTVSMERTHSDAQAQKRRKMRRGDEEDGEEGRGDRALTASHRSVSPEARSESTPHPQGSPSTLSGRYKQLTSNKSNSQILPPFEPITLNDSEDALPRPVRQQDRVNTSDDEAFDNDDSEPRVVNGRQADEPVVVDDGDNSANSDDEFAHLRARARARAAAAKKSSEASAPRAVIQLTDEEILQAKIKERLEQLKKTGSVRKMDSDSAVSPEKGAPGTLVPNPEDDRKLQILVTSVLEGTKIVKFLCRASQNFGTVREVWCNRQEILSDEQKKSILLSYKGTRLYDTTTCRRIQSKKEDKFIIEAWTPDAWDNRLAEKQKRPQEQGEEEEGEEENEQINAPPAPPERKWRVTLKARGIEDFKLIVRASTKVAKMIAGFRQTTGIGEDKKVTLWFDGEELDEEMQVKDTELEDLDSIEVHID